MIAYKTYGCVRNVNKLPISDFQKESILKEIQRFIVDADTNDDSLNESSINRLEKTILEADPSIKIETVKHRYIIWICLNGYEVIDIRLNK